MFEKYFQGFEVRKVTEFEAQPDERMIYGGMDIGAWELKIDTGGNTYGRIAVLCGSGAEPAKSQKSCLGCVPMLYMEISGATLRVCGSATLQRQFLFEPLT